MTAPSSGTPLPQRPAAANGTEFPTQRALGRRAFRSARRCPGAERGPQLRAQPPGTTAAAADAVPRAVLPNFRRLHEARSARGPARTSGRLPPGASFPAVKRTPRTPQRTEGNSARGPARPYLQTPFRPRRAAPGPARRREPRAPPGRRRGGRSRGAAQRRPPPRRPRSAAAVRRAAPGERRGAERSGAGRAGGAAAGGNKAPLCGGPGRAGGCEPRALPRLPPNPRRTHGPPQAHRALRCSHGRAPRPRHRLPPGARPPRRSRRRRSRRHVTRRGGQAGAGTAAAPPRPGGARPAGSRSGAGPAPGAARGARPRGPGGSSGSLRDGVALCGSAPVRGSQTSSPSC